MMYGTNASDKVAVENLTCRQIVKEISNFGINERQRLLLIYLLALEIEDVDVMQTLTQFVKELGSGTLFISDAAQASEKR